MTFTISICGLRVVMIDWLHFTSGALIINQHLSKGKRLFDIAYYIMSSTGWYFNDEISFILTSEEFENEF